MTTEFEVARADTGNYRLYFRKRNHALFCIQNDGGWGKDDFRFYFCSRDGESDCEAKWPDELKGLDLSSISLIRRAT